MQTRLSVVDQVFGHNRAPMSEVLAKDFDELAKDAAALIAEAEKLPRTIKTEAELGDFGHVVTKLRALSSKVDGDRKDEGAPLLAATKDLNGWFNEIKGRLDGARDTLEQVATDYQRAVAAQERAKREEEARKLREQEEAARAKAEESSGITAARAEGRAENLSSQAERAEDRAGAKAADLVRTNVGGVTASAKTLWDFRIKDYAALQASLGTLGPYIARADVEKAIRSLVRIQKDGAVIPGVEVFEDTRATFRK